MSHFKKTVVVIPTYNEVHNIGVLLGKLLNLFPEITCLVVDDNSKDGTQSVVNKMQIRHNNVLLLNRKHKEGLASAYMAGFLCAFQKDFLTIVQMDADLSHRPEDLENLLIDRFENNWDLVIGSRYIAGGGVLNWSILRKLISKFGNYYANFFLKTPISDLTGGFNVWGVSTLKKIVELGIQAEGYGFQIEMKYRAFSIGSKIKEYPITFVERASGQSKMSKKIVLEAMSKVPKMTKKRENL